MATTVFILTGTTTFTKPGGWTNGSGTLVECIGNGGRGVNGQTSHGGAGGGAGAYANKAGITISGSSTTCRVGASNGTSTTYFDATTTVQADYGRAASGTTGGAGGLASNSTGDVTVSGGSGGTSLNGFGGGGGGGAAGDDGASNPVINGNGGHGGDGNTGATGITGSTPNGSNQGTGDGSGSSTPAAGGAGPAGTQYDGTHGFGGGGGGGGGQLHTTGVKNGANGGAGGNYGGGGGGGGASNNGGTNGTGGAGAAGLIVVTYGLVLSTNLSVLGSVTPSPAVTRSTGKIVAGAVTPSPSARQATSVRRLGAVTPSQAVLRAVGKQVAGSVTPAGALKNAVGKPVAGAVTPAGLIVAGIPYHQSALGSASTSGYAVKQALLPRLGAVTPSGSASRAVAKIVSGAVTPAGRYAVAVGKAVLGAVTPAGTLVRQAAKIILGAAAPSGIAATTRTFHPLLLGAVTPSPGVGKSYDVHRLGAVTPAGLIRRGAVVVLEWAVSLLVGGSKSSHPSRGDAEAVGVADGTLGHHVNSVLSEGISASVGWVEQWGSLNRSSVSLGVGDGVSTAVERDEEDGFSISESRYNHWTFVCDETLSVGERVRRASNAVAYDVMFKSYAALSLADWASWADGGPPGYGPFQTLVPGNYTYRYAKVGVRVRGPVVEGLGGVDELKLNVDVPDLNDRGTASIASSGSTTVSFNQSYHAAPEVSATPSGGTDPFFILITAITKTGFTAKCFSATTPGTQVAGTISWQAKGY